MQFLFYSKSKNYLSFFLNKYLKHILTIPRRMSLYKDKLDEILGRTFDQTKGRKPRWLPSAERNATKAASKI